MVQVLGRFRPNKYTTIQVSSVLLPGLLLLLEIGYATIPTSRRSNLWEVFRYLSDLSEGIAGGVIILGVLGAALFAYAIGFLARRLGFFVLEISQNLFNASPFTRFFRTPGEEDVLNKFAEFFPDNASKPWFGDHPAVLRAAADPPEGEDESTEPQFVADGWFGYFKVFVQGTDERFSIDWAEFEVNTMVALVAPTVGGVLVMLDLISPEMGTIWRAGVACAIVLVMMLSIVRIRFDERLDAATKFLLANVVPPWPVVGRTKPGDGGS